MNVLDSIILGAIQGLTEFIPISSSGHLIIARDLFGWHGSSDLSFDAVLQLATAIALVVYFRKDIWKILKSVFSSDKTMLWAIIAGTIPAVIAGLFLESYMETIFRSAILVSFVLIAGSIFMFFAEKTARQDKSVNVKRGLLIGLTQCLALIPGFSRSGATISGGLFTGLKREEAARFSFLLSIPIIIGSGSKKLLELWGNGSFQTDGLNLFLGSLAAFVVGLLAIDFLMKYLKNHTLNLFIIYRIILAFIVLFVLV